MIPDLQEHSYHRQIALLIEAQYRPNFWILLTRTLRNFVEFDNWVAVLFSNHEKPLVFIENPTPDGKVDLLFQDYVNGLYLLDPFYVAACDRPQSGLFLLDEVAPENFAQTDYYRLYFQLIVVADEVQFLCALDGGKTLSLSLGRASKFTQTEIAFLNLVAPWVIALMRKRFQYEQQNEHAKENGNSTSQIQETVNADTVASRAKLTEREIEISQLVLSGFSGKNIADKLKISIETVKAHKKHIYNKLNINSQHELFSIFYQAHADSAEK
jgi:DNA-binding CsgD family transcriptional regulator